MLNIFKDITLSSSRYIKMYFCHLTVSRYHWTMNDSHFTNLKKKKNHFLIFFSFNLLVVLTHHTATCLLCKHVETDVLILLNVMTGTAVTDPVSGFKMLFQKYITITVVQFLGETLLCKLGTKHLSDREFWLCLIHCVQTLNCLH